MRREAGLGQEALAQRAGVFRTTVDRMETLAKGNMSVSVLRLLASVPLRKLGVARKQLIDTEKDQYPATRLWAEAIHRQCPQAQGLSWVSRQDDSARAVMLFGGRISGGTLQVLGVSHSLTEDASTYDVVLDLTERIGVAIVPGGS